MFTIRWVVFVILITSGTVFSKYEAESQKEPIDELTILFNEYLDYRHSIQLQFDKVKELEWASLLSSSLKQNRRSASASRVCTHLVACYNTLGAWESSIQLLEHELHQNDSLLSKNFLYKELVEVCTLSALDSQTTGNKKEAEKNAKKAVENCKNYWKLQPPSGNRDIIARYCAIGFMLSSKVIDLQSNLLNDSQSAVELCSDVINKFSQLNESEQFDAVLLSGYTLDYFFVKKMSAELQSKVPDSAIKTLEQFGQLKFHPHSQLIGASYYAQDAISKVYPDGGEDYCLALHHWIEANQEDAYTPFCLFHIASDYYARKDYEKSLPILLNIRHQYWETILQHDTKTLGMNRGGDATFILDMILHIYQYQNNVEGASAIIKELQETTHSKNMAVALIVQDEIEKRKAQDVAKISFEKEKNWKRIILLSIMNVIVLTMIFYLIFKKKRK
ncbi:hypothetical protein FACS189427_02630 [Planctomycetales bacterium]|nr:hypothetical protein FACS189427_02630 [Planctomycetales bacterium]